MTAPDLTDITYLLLTKALDRLPKLDDGGEQWSLSAGEQWSLSDEGGQHAILWRRDPATDEWREAARVSLTVDVQPHSYVVVGGVVYTGEEGA